MQTSVEWLEEQINEKIQLLKSDWYILDNLFEQAKKINKREIEDAYWDGGQDIPMSGKSCEQYYQKIFKKD